MQSTVKAIAGLAVACTICAAPAALGATKSTRPPGTTYVATTQIGGVHIVVSADRRQVRRGLFAYEQRCNDGDKTYDFDEYRAIPIGANRRFSHSYQSGPQASTTVPGATFSYTESFRGVLNKAGTRIAGTARATFTWSNPAGGSYTCDTGTVNFKAAD